METTSLAEGSNALLDRLDRVMTDEFDAKMLGRVGRGYFAEIKFLKRTLRGSRDVLQLERGAHGTSQSSPCRLGLQTLEF